MEIRYVREFVTLAAVGNFIEASHQLFISQSTLSRHLQALEAELGVPLFTRTTRRVEINEYGSMFLPYAKDMLQAHDTFTASLADRLRTVRDTLNIGSIPSMAQYSITDLIAGFQLENPACALNITEAESAELKSLLQQGECDLAFVREMPGEQNEFTVVPYTEDRLAAVLPATHPLAKDTQVTLEQLRDENFLLLPENTLMYRLCITACRAAGFEPRVGFIGYRAENIVDLVGKGMGVSLLTKKPTAYMARPTIVVLDVEPRIATRINIVYPKEKKLSVAAGLFLRYIESRT